MLANSDKVHTTEDTEGGDLALAAARRSTKTVKIASLRNGKTVRKEAMCKKAEQLKKKRTKDR